MKFLAHQKMEQADRTLINDLKPIISDLLTFTDTIIPDAKETVRKYADVKFEYLRKDIKKSFINRTILFFE